MTKELKILYEDDNIISVDKPAGIATAHEKGKPTLLSLLEEKYNKKFFTVHRLDKDVSGVIIFVKNEDAHKQLSKLFENQEVQKTYLALVHGIVKDDEGVIDKLIRQFGSGRMGIDEQNGKKSITKFKVLERRNNTTLLEINLLTGRRHQIRVHLYSIGHPIVGDKMYGDKVLQTNYTRLMLHAGEIKFRFEQGNDLIIRSELPLLFRIKN